MFVDVFSMSVSMKLAQEAFSSKTPYLAYPEKFVLAGNARPRKIQCRLTYSANGA